MRTVLLVILLLFIVPSVVAQSAPFNFVAWGDTKSARDVLSSLSNQAKQLNPAFTLYSGDLEDSGFTQSGALAWKEAMNGGNGNGMFDKVFPVRGNHDSGNTAGWQSFYSLKDAVPRVGGSNYSAMTEDLTYSFDYQNAHFTGIDVTGDASKISAEEISWLDRDLTAAESRGLTHAFIYFHGPIYCVAEHCSCDARTCATNSAVKSLIEVINKHPIVSATFHGHEHTYAHIHVDNTRIPEVTHPFEEFVTGDAGAGPVGCSKSFRFDYCMPDHGFISVAVNGAAFVVNYYKQGSTTPVKTLSFTKTGVSTVTPTAGACTGKSRGDADCDGAVEMDDFEIFRKEYVHAVTSRQADFNADGVVDLADFERWRSTKLGI